MARWMLGIAAAVSIVCLVAPGSGANAADETHIKDIDFSFDGPFGTYDPAQLQRGFKIYKQVCSNCHSMDLMHFRNLGEAGGPEFSEAAVKALAADVTVTDGFDDSGEPKERPGRASDAFKAPFANDQEARAANGGALPPDLSVIAKAREGGPDYIYSILTGFEEAPKGFKMQSGMYYNTAFPGHQIAMPPPLSDDVVDYTDGTKPTLKNYAKDVSAYLMWAAEPKLEQRHAMGFRVMIYLLILAGLFYFAKRRIWSRVEH